MDRIGPDKQFRAIDRITDGSHIVERMVRLYCIHSALPFLLADGFQIDENAVHARLFGNVHDFGSVGDIH